MGCGVVQWLVVSKSQKTIILTPGKTTTTMTRSKTLTLTEFIFWTRKKKKKYEAMRRALEQFQDWNCCRAVKEPPLATPFYTANHLNALDDCGTFNCARIISKQTTYWWLKLLFCCPSYCVGHFNINLSLTLSIYLLFHQSFLCSFKLFFF